MKTKLLAMVAAIFCCTLAAKAAGYTIYYDNSVTQWESVGIHYWGDPQSEWPGIEMDHVDGDIWAFTFSKSPSKVQGFLFKHATKFGDAYQTADVSKAPTVGHIYKGAGGEKGKVTDLGEYKGEPAPTTSTVTASPKTGTSFAEKITVTLTAAPAAPIYYTTDGSNPTTSSARYSAPLTFSESTTLKTLTVLDGAEKVQTFEYTKLIIIPFADGALNTDYYKVNPDGRNGRNRTVSMNFQKVNDNRQCMSTTALSNWTEEDLICQGVARDIASAFRGKHEYPVVDSYAVYAAYDATNLYLGVQYVYAVYDEGGDGIADNDRAKPWMMDGRLMFAFDTDPNKEFEGILDNGNTIWDGDGQYNVMRNGTDAILLCNTKSTVGIPGYFIPNANGKASYDAAYCKSIPAPFYGMAEGLLPHITEIWAQEKFGYDPDLLRTNTGFVNIINKCARDKHTFYEFRIPLSTMGITESYIRDNGIGVMVIDTYGQGAIGCTPYDPCVFDNVNTPYSKDQSSSAEKEDKDIFTFKHARIGGKIVQNSGIEAIEADADAPAEFFTISGQRVEYPQAGLYIMRRGNKVQKVLLK